MEKKPKKLGREFWEQDAKHRAFLAERIEYHKRKLAEEKAEREKRDLSTQ
jgi:hypothetical protein